MRLAPFYFFATPRSSVSIWNSYCIWHTVVGLLFSSVPQPENREVSQSWVISTSMSSLQSSCLYPLHYFLHLPKKEQAQTHRGQQGIPSCLSCIRCKWKVRCQISCQQSTPNMSLHDTKHTLGVFIDLDKCDKKEYDKYEYMCVSVKCWCLCVCVFACVHARLWAIYLLWRAGVSVELSWNPR